MTRKTRERIMERCIGKSPREAENWLKKTCMAKYVDEDIDDVYDDGMVTMCLTMVVQNCYVDLFYDREEFLIESVKFS